MTCLKVRSPHMNKMIPPIDNIIAVHNTTFTKIYGAILITLQIGLMRAEGNPGHVNLFIHTEIYLSKYDTQYSMKAL